MSKSGEKEDKRRIDHIPKNIKVMLFPDISFFAIIYSVF